MFLLLCVSLLGKITIHHLLVQGKFSTAGEEGERTYDRLIARLTALNPLWALLNSWGGGNVAFYF